MKRLLCLLCALLMVFTCGCGDNDECPHNYKIIKTVEATCTRDGYNKYECNKCGHTYKTEVSKNEHSFINGLCQFCGALEQPAQDDIDVKPDVGGEIGNLSPDFQLMKYFEDGVVSSDQLRGKVTVINFWYVYCSSCIQELNTEFPKLRQNYGDNVQIVVVHSFEEFGMEIPSWINNNLPTNTGFIHCRDNEGDQLFSNFGGTSAWPITVILDENGIIQYKIFGSTTFDEMKAIIDPLLAD